MIKLNINGCDRKVIIDDYFPVDRHNELLCSRTTNRGELWVSLLEKAYMKVMGGYDFPGSNSNIDLHALTGWIPERLAMHGNHTDFNKDVDFERMFKKLHEGGLLITVATPPMSKEQEARSGLVSTHAYAVLDIRKFKDLRLFQLKNPWSHVRWRGNFSEYDIKNWTDELKSALNYDPNLAYNIDNGVFWIDYESLINYFDVFYLSWDPHVSARAASSSKMVGGRGSYQRSVQLERESAIFAQNTSRPVRVQQEMHHLDPSHSSHHGQRRLCRKQRVHCTCRIQEQRKTNLLSE